MSLASQIEALCVEHELTNLTVSYFIDGPAKGFHAYAHGGGNLGSSNAIGNDLESAIGSAIADLNVKRGSGVVVPQLEAA